MTDDKNNLDETKIFKTNDGDSDETLNIPFVNKLDTNLEETINLSDEELIDEGLNNIKAAEAEIIRVLEVQNNGNGDDNMAKKKKKKRLSGLGKFNIFLLMLVFLMFVGFGAAGYIWMKLSVGTPDLDLASLKNETSTIILDKDDNQFFDLAMYTWNEETGEGGASYEDIDYNGMSQSIVDAFVSIEDSRFFKHNGFDIPRFSKAIIENISAGGFSQGGSTVTMQLIKTSHLSADKQVERKVQEINLSLEVEKVVPKHQILEYYVNKINYGAGNTRGLESAAQYFFNKSAGQLNISESALLAGLVNRPNAFSPIYNLDEAYERRADVLYLMNYHGYIDDEEEALANAIKIENQLTDESSKSLSTTDNPYIDYVNAVIDEIYDVLGIDIVATPLTIYTNMDPVVQLDIASIQNEEGFTYPDENMQSAIAIGENETGALIALGGGRDSQVVKGRNRATRMFKQPGSVTKPLVAYALAFEHLGWSTSHVVEDRPLMYAGTDKVLANWDRRYRGEMTLKAAVAQSINIPAYNAVLAAEGVIGRSGVADYLHDNLGFTQVTRDNYNTQFAIGGSSFQISPAELFGAQAVMMNGGFYTKPHTVRYVETADKKIIKDEFDYPKTRVLSEEAAYLVSVLEENNVSSGTINRMENLGGRPYKVYAKTGISDYGDSAVQYGVPVGAGKDQWMMASSKGYTSAVWMGWDKAEAGKENWWTSPKYSYNPLGKVNHRLLTTIHKDKPNPGNVERPSGVTSFNHVLSTFPYANPIEGIDAKYITTGEIAKKNLNLVDLDKASIDVETVESFVADIKVAGKNKTISLGWTEYPEDGAIKGPTYDISLGSIKATGTRLFHPSWIFGPVQYKATIYVDGQKLEEVRSDANSFAKDFTIPNDKTIKVCGYYGNSVQNGVETCVNLDNPKIDEKIVIPNFTTQAEIDNFIIAQGLNKNLWTVGIPTLTFDPTLVGKVADVRHNGSSIMNKDVQIEKLKEMEIKISFYTQLKLPTGTYKDFENWAKNLGLNIKDNDDAEDDKPVTKYNINDSNQVYLPGSDVTIKINSIKAFTN
ncbi:MAG: hypothetical protein GX769_00605 [Erysipelothrix sp.]|nr:hypothetical protein [Erysipelothrix sp.]